MKDKQPPAWLARRKYFQRIGRWQKPKERVVEDEREDRATNVVQFPTVRQRQAEMSGT
jgi:hypothetical protein